MRSLRSAAPLILAVLVAAILRTDQLLDQIPVGDEWHALQVVSALDCGWIFTHFGGADHCIPLALYYELVADAAGLGEVAFRLPSLIAGLALVVLVPLLVRDIVGKPAADALAFLLAVSPMLVYYSRWARPYAIALLLALVGTLALWRWRLGAGNRWAWGYGVCAVLGGWFLPPFIPFLFAPLAFLLGERLVRPGSGRSPWVVLCLAAGVLAGAALLLLPPWVVDSHNLAFKMGRSAIELRTLEQAFKFYAGTHRAGLLLGVGALAAAGIALALRRNGSFCCYLGFILGCQGLALALARPEMIGSGAIFGRYLLPALVVLQLFVAVALGELDRMASRRWSHAAPLFAALGALVLFSYGPLPAIHTRPNNWTSHSDFQDTYDPAMRVVRYAERGRRKERLPAFYEDLGAREPGSLLIVEAPWYLDHVPFHMYQRTHRQRMCIGFVGRGSNPGNELPLDDGRFSFQSFVDVGDHESVVERGVDYVIFHRNLKRELRHNDRLERVPVDDHLLEYRQRFGAPVFEDKEIVVFEVAERAPGRGSRPAAAGGAGEGQPP